MISEIRFDDVGAAVTEATGADGGPEAPRLWGYLEVGNHDTT